MKIPRGMPYIGNDNATEFEHAVLTLNRVEGSPVRLAGSMFAAKKPGYHPVITFGPSIKPHETDLNGRQKRTAGVIYQAMPTSLLLEERLQSFAQLLSRLIDRGHCIRRITRFCNHRTRREIGE